jgi:hypothetical protein
VAAILGDELTPASFACAHRRQLAILAAAMSVEGGCAIGAGDPKILEAIVIRDAIDMVEDQRHPTTSPALPLTAHFAAARFEFPVSKSRCFSLLRE